MSVKVHEAYCLDSQQDRLLWWDDFLGDQLQDEWNITFGGTGAGAVIDQQTGGIYRLRCPAANDTALLNLGNIRSLLVTKRASAEFRIKINSTANNSAILYLAFDGNNRINIYESGNWWIECRDGGISTNLDSGIVADTNYHIFRIECHTHGGNHVHFYIDGTETANSPINTNIPDDATDYLQPQFYCAATAGAVAEKQMDIDYCVVRQDI